MGIGPRQWRYPMMSHLALKAMLFFFEYPKGTYYTKFVQGFCLSIKG